MRIFNHLDDILSNAAGEVERLVTRIDEWDDKRRNNFIIEDTTPLRARFDEVRGFYTTCLTLKENTELNIEFSKSVYDVNHGKWDLHRLTNAWDRARAEKGFNSFLFPAPFGYAQLTLNNVEPYTTGEKVLKRFPAQGWFSQMDSTEKSLMRYRDEYNDLMSVIADDEMKFGHNPGAPNNPFL
ncbi:MAG: hypothetical protein WBK77_03810 [Alphaproteobacteria bacterium]